MYTRSKTSILSRAMSAAALLFVTLIGASAFTRPMPIRGAVAPAQLGEAQLVAHHQVDMSKAPGITAAVATGRASAPKAQPVKELPFLTTVSPAEFARIKAYAATNPHAPRSTHSLSIPPSANTPAPSGSIAPNTAGTNTAFAGMENTPTSCPSLGSGGCTPPSIALAASPSWVFEGVNTSFAVYDTSGTLQPGWPKSFQAFFNVPNPGACDPNGPFLAAPRAFYDPNDNRFWALVLQIEGAQGIVAPSCPFQSLAWAAVSPVGTPIGTWNVYSFNLNENGSAAPFAALSAGFGFNGQAVYWSTNMYDASTVVFQYAEVFEANKASMEANLHNFTAMGFFPLRIPNPAANTTPPGPGPDAIMADSVQPVLTEAKSYDPRAEFLVSTFNLQGDLAGHDCSTTPCTQFIAWAFSNPIAHDSGGDPPTLTYTFPTTQSYVVPPNADEAGCTLCIRTGQLNFQTGDLSVSGMPVYHDGLVSFAWEVGVNNGTQVVPAIQWSQARLLLTDTHSSTNPNSIGPAVNCTKSVDVCADIDLSSAEAAGGVFSLTGDGAAMYGSVMPDQENNLYMVYEHTDGAKFPETRYTSMRVTSASGNFDTPGGLLKSGDTIYASGSCTTASPCRWGFYTAASYDGFASDQVWFVGEYATASTAVVANWGTWIGRAQFTLSAS